MNLKDLNTGTKLKLGFGIVLLLTAITGIVGLYGLKTIQDKSSNLAIINDVQKGFSEARVQMRAFSMSKDGKFFLNAKKSMSNSMRLLDSLSPRLAITENIILAGELGHWLKEYDSLMGKNRQFVLDQIQNSSLLDDYSDKILSELKSSGVPETHPVYYHFAMVRVNTNYLRLNVKDEYYNSARDYVQQVIADATKLRNQTLLSLINSYSTEIDQYVSISKQNDAIQPVHLNAGINVSERAIKMNKNITNFVENAKKSTTASLIIFSFFAIAIGILISFFITNYLTTMIGRGVKLAEVYASGELTYKVSKKDLEAKDEMGALARGMVAMGNKIEEVVTNINNGAHNVFSASQEISTTTIQLSEWASEQAASVEEVSSSMEQMVSNIQQNADNAMEAEKIAMISSQKMQEVASAAQNSLTAVRAITGKIDIINDIAFQTNILALNAAVEAARAGEHGRGFAVVAAEVRKLAERSKIASNEIVELSKASLLATETAGKLMEQVVPEIEKTVRLVKEIAAASHEQNVGSDQINSAVQQLNNASQQNASSSEELATNAEELASQADELREIISFFSTTKNLINKADHAKVNRKSDFNIKQKSSHTMHNQAKRPPVKSLDTGFKLHLDSDNSENQYEKF
jgi:methyl-accepting chemotaxis protein